MKPLKDIEGIVKSIFNKAPLGIYTLDSSGKITTFNKEMLRMSGAKKLGDVIGLNALTLSSYKAVGLDEHFKKGLKGKEFEVVTEYTSYTRKKESYRHYRGIPIFSKNGKKVEQLLLLVEDVTDQKNAEKKLKESELRYRTIFKASPAVIIIVDKEGIVIDANDKVSEWTGSNAKKLIGKSIFSLSFVAFPEKAKVLKDFSEQMDEVLADPYEFSMTDKDGNIKIGLIQKARIKDSSGKFPHDLIMISNITKQKEDEEKILSLSKFPSESPHPVIRIDLDQYILYANKASHELLKYWGVRVGKKIPKDIFVKTNYDNSINQYVTFEQSYDDKILLFTSLKTREEYINLYARDITKEKEVDKMKSEFVSLASHQLKTPLAGILWSADLLMRSNPEMKSNKYLTRIYESNKRMIKLVEDLLNVSSIESGEGFQDSYEKVDIVRLIEDVISPARLDEGKDDIRIQFKHIPHKIVASLSEEKIHLAFDNIIGNAVKYSKKGSKVVIECKKQRNSTVLCSVKDTGIGIPKNQQKRLFERFFRGANAVKKDADGTGLGLYIAKAIIKKHGGNIWFESKINRGTTFFISLPIKQQGL